jgi:hypothetical protein
LSYSTTFEVGVVSNGVTFIPDIVKISQLVQKLKGEHKDACMHAQTQNTHIHCLSHTHTHTHAHARAHTHRERERDIISVLSFFRKERKKENKALGKQARV